MFDGDTIVAIATAPGIGGIAVIRLSGPRSAEILQKAFQPAGAGGYTPRALRYGRVLSSSGEPLDEAMAVLMPAPHSYTREDVAEIQCHGGSIAARRVMARLIELGARAAEPGEFTKRAFLNGRIDLSGAEAVMSMIGARSEIAARAAQRQLMGGASAFVRECRDKLTGLLAKIEAAADFPEEIDEQMTACEVCAEARAIAAEIEKRADPRAARIVREGARVALVGKPNVGKSSLMNALLRFDRAIVSDVPGTTRDVLTERLEVHGVAVELTDTAGQRTPSDPIEAEGVERARKAQQDADLVILVVDGSQPAGAEDVQLLEAADQRTIVAVNKSDLPLAFDRDLSAMRAISVSAVSGAGMDQLLDVIGEIARSVPLEEGQLTERRHVALALRARERLVEAAAAIEGGAELDVAAIDLWEGLNLLGEITGDTASESVIEEIFARFCVGK